MLPSSHWWALSRQAAPRVHCWTDSEAGLEAHAVTMQQRQQQRQQQQQQQQQQPQQQQQMDRGSVVSRVR